MYCKKCGAELKPNAKFCSKCGSPVSLPSAVEEMKVDRKEIPASEIPKAQENSETAPKKRKKPIALIVVLLLAVCVAVGIVVYLNSDVHHYKKNMKTANARYEEGNYREALEAYDAALKIDRESEEAVAGKIAAYMGLGEQLYREEDYEDALGAYKSVISMQEDNTDAYLWVSNAYIRLEEFEQAVTILQDGYQVTKDMSLKTREEYLMDNIVLVMVDILYREGEDGEWRQKSREAGGYPSPNKYIYNYDDSGKLSSEEVYILYDSITFDGSLLNENEGKKIYDVTEVNTTVYDDIGDIVEQIQEYFYDDGHRNGNHEVIFRDSNGTELYTLGCGLDTEINYENGKIIGVSYSDTSGRTLTYDDEGRLINVDYKSDQYTYQCTYSYDSLGKVLSCSEYRIDRYYNDQLEWSSTKSYSTIYSYDDQERLIKKTVYENNGENEYLFSETVYEYDSSGILIYEEYAESPPSPYYYVNEWVYDSSGKLIEDHYSPSVGSSWHEITYSYDMEGDISREKCITGDYEYETTYTCDMFGNVVYTETDTFDIYSQETTTLYTEYTNTYAFIGDLGDDIDSQNAETSEGEEVVAEAEEADSGETASADAAEASDREETAEADKTESSGDEVSDIAEERESENEKPVLDIVVEDEVKQIREWFYGTQNSLDSYEQSTSGNVTYYLEDGIPVKIVVKKGTDGWNYAREYYYHGGVFYFAFIFNGGDEHRLYFKEDQMIRYIDQNKSTYDYGQTDQFSDWETPALQEAYRLLEGGWN